MMFMWALTLRMVIMWWEVFKVFIIQVMRSLYEWLYWEYGFFYVVEEKIYVIKSYL